MGKIDKALEKAGIEQIATEIRADEKGPDYKSQTLKSKVQSVEQANHSRKNFQERPVDYRVIVYHDPASVAAEHFKVLRGHIMHPANGGKIRSVLVTSAMEQEGKTMVACNLAVSIAQSLDSYVMLVDADVRRANVHNMLGLREGEGLTDYLETGSPLFNYLVKGPLDRMTVLQAGSTVRNPAELMTSEKTKDLLEEVKQRYEDRFVVIDSPPLNLAAETGILAQHVDATIMVVRYGISDKNAVEEALSKLDRNRVLGMIFNGFEITPRKYTYYKKKYYGSRE